MEIDIIKPIPKEISLPNVGRYHRLLELLNKDNKILKKAHGNSCEPTRKELMECLSCSSTSTYNLFMAEMEDSSVVKRFKGFNNKRIICVNPTYAKHKNFKWNKIIFELFKEDLEDELNKFTYMILEAKFNNKKIDFSKITIDDLPYRLSGLYRLYLEDDLLYIGKSRCIKKRIKQHSYNKEFNFFDFIEIKNESNKNLLEVYLIDKYKPKYNKELIEDVTCNIEIKEPKFNGKIKIRS